MDLWFGDSWPIGEELGQSTDSFDKNIFPNVKVGADNPLKAFSTLVSKYRGVSFINFARSASSIDFSLYQLMKFCAENKSLIENYNKQFTAFLCITAQIRGFGIDHVTGKHQHYFNNYRKSVDETAIYDSIVALNSFYSICKLYNFHCHFIPVFCDLIIPTELEHMVMFDSAIISKTSLVELTFGEKFIDDSLYIKGVSENDMYKHLTLKDWISPNRMHPNIIGHKRIAYKLIELLDNTNKK